MKMPNQIRVISRVPCNCLPARPGTFDHQHLSHVCSFSYAATYGLNLNRISLVKSGFNEVKPFCHAAARACVQVPVSMYMSSSASAQHSMSLMAPLQGVATCSTTFSSTGISINAQQQLMQPTESAAGQMAFTTDCHCLEGIQGMLVFGTGNGGLMLASCRLMEAHTQR